MTQGSPRTTALLPGRVRVAASQRSSSRLAPNLPEKLKLEREERQLETKRDESWRADEVAARGIEHRKDALMDEVEKKRAQHITEQVVFTVRWRLR